jgi:hypothetical protein
MMFLLLSSHFWLSENRWQLIEKEWKIIPVSWGAQLFWLTYHLSSLEYSNDRTSYRRRLIYAKDKFNVLKPTGYVMQKQV